MIEFAAAYYDGKTSKKRDVRIHFEVPNHLRISGLDHVLRYELSHIRVSARIANMTRSIHLPDGSKCETDDNDAVDKLMSLQKRGRVHAFINLLESKMRYVIASLIVTVLLLFVFIHFGIPILAKKAAFNLPDAVAAEMGGESLDILDRTMFSPTKLDHERQVKLQGLFDTITGRIPRAPDMQIEFRKGGKIGANACALPSGIIVLTDEFVDLAENDDEIVAVMAHEIGHVVYRHTLRSMLQNSVVILIMASLTGDLASITTLSAAMPAWLLEANYSRRFEREADEYGLQYMLDNDISPHHFADILLKLEQSSGRGQSSANFLSTHPSTEDRVEMFSELPE
jgi:Zn-dependent protease with chaperone function